MTPTVSSPRRRGATLALSGMFLAGTVLAGTPVAFAVPSDAVSAINEKGASFSADFPWFGAPTGEAMDVKGGAMRDYEGGTIFYSKDTGAHVMYGEILKHYKALGGPETSELGFPKNDESDTGDSVGRFNEFSAPEGAAIYWNPQLGAWAIKGKVLEAWNQSGGIKGPFGYPSADMTVVDGLQTGKFAGSEGKEIQWSKAAGLVTIPAALAAKIPGFGTGGTTSVSKSGVAAPAKKGEEKEEKKGGFKLWWLIPILALLGLLAFLPRLFRKKTVVEPARVAPKVVVPPPAPAPAPVKKVVTPPPPRPTPAPKPVTPPPAPKPVVKTPPPPPAPKPLVAPPPAPRPVHHIREEVAEVKEHVREDVAETKAHIRGEVAETKAHIREEVADVKAHIREVHEEHDVAPVIRYETHTPTETSIRVTYENNALGDHQESRADKSDLTPDYLQE